MSHAIRWILPEPVAGQRSDLHPLVASILAHRAIADADTFLDPKLQALSDPFMIQGMEDAVARLFAAIDAGQRITLFGDYDVDGVASLALLHDALTAYGSTPATTLPHRMDEGYGLSAESLNRCIADTSPDLIVAVDCGTTATNEALLLRQQGIDLVILDHHEATGPLPVCAALVNPKVSGELPYLCAAGVVFKLVHALLKTRLLPKARFDLKAHLDLVALATVADIVPLIGENRLLVRHGLSALSSTTRPGLVALKAVAGIANKITTDDIGFKLGPRLNAAGRLDSAQCAYDLLVCRDHTIAGELANDLDLRNRERQGVVQDILVQAMSHAEARADDKVLVLADHGWHPGVVGIVAARVMRQHHRPTIVIGFDDHGTGKGSARSIPGASLTALIDDCRDHLVKGGGHAMAAGITIRHDHIDAFRMAALAHAEASWPPAIFDRTHTADAVAHFQDINHDMLDAWEKLAPFGNSFTKPLLYTAAVHPASTPRVLKDKHLKLSLTQLGATLEAIWFNADFLHSLPPPPWDVLFHLETNEWNGKRKPQLQLRALRASIQS